MLESLAAALVEQLTVRSSNAKPQEFSLFFSKGLGLLALKFPWMKEQPCVTSVQVIGSFAL
jgi:hypothetical protein